MRAIAAKIENDLLTVVNRSADLEFGSVLSGPNKFRWTSNSLISNRLEALDTLVVTKSHPGFERACIDDLTRLLSVILRGEITGLKYLVFDFAHHCDCESVGAEGFDELVAANAELIMGAPVITVAWARSFMAGADLEFASQCAMLVAETDALFSFDGDPARLFGLYSSLARKIGFVRAQRLMEQGAVLGAQEMQDLLLAKDVVEPQHGTAAIGRYVQQCGRRYNAAYSIFRAQRSVMASIAPVPERRVQL